MEKKIKFEDVVAFIKKAMDLDFDIEYSLAPYSGNSDLMVYKELGNKTIRKYIDWTYKDDELLINLNSGFTLEKFTDYIIEVSDKKDILKWEFLMEEIKEYSINKVENDFKNFFKDLQNSVKDINDLDNEDE